MLDLILMMKLVKDTASVSMHRIVGTILNAEISFPELLTFHFPFFLHINLYKGGKLLQRPLNQLLFIFTQTDKAFLLSTQNTILLPLASKDNKTPVPRSNQ